jgi:hypothetical protein
MMIGEYCTKFPAFKEAALVIKDWNRKLMKENIHLEK